MNLVTGDFELSDGQNGNFKAISNKLEYDVKLAVKLAEAALKLVATVSSEIRTTAACNAAAPTGTSKVTSIKTGSSTGTPTGSSSATGTTKTSGATANQSNTTSTMSDTQGSGGDMLKGSVMVVFGAGLGAVMAAVL